MSTNKSFIKRIPPLAYGIVALLIVFCVFGKGFLSYMNIMNILSSAAILMVVACGMEIAILSAQIDLSIGGCMGFAAVSVGLYIHQFETVNIGHILVAFALGMAIGMCFGIVNGLLIGVFRYNYWLVTFATMNIGYGLSKVINGGDVVAGMPKMFRRVAGGEIFGGLPSVVLFAVVVILIMAFITFRTRFGMNIYSVGDSEPAAAQSGISVPKTRFLIYLTSGLLSGLGGVLLVSKTNSAGPITADGYEWDAIAAVIIGGTSFSGGKGSVFGTIIGAIVMTFVINGLQMVGFTTYWKQFFKGVFILSIMIVDVIGSMRRQEQVTRRVYKYE